MDERVRVVIVGAGPAGAAAAIFLKRAGFEPLLLEESEPGGLLREANLVENYPGFPDGVVGRELASLIAEQLRRLEVRVVRTTATKVNAAGQSFRTRTSDGDCISDAVVIATGTEPRKTDLPGADAIEGKSLFYGVSSLSSDEVDGKRISILGGGDAAFDYAINLSDKGGSVTILSRSEPTCLQLLTERVRERKIDVLTGCEARSVRETPEGAAITCEGDNCPEEIACDLVLVAHGRKPRLDILDPGLRRRAVTDNPPETGVSGLFLAGDVVRGKNRQAAIAAGDGVLSAMLIERYLKDRGGHL